MLCAYTEEVTLNLALCLFVEVADEGGILNEFLFLEAVSGNCCIIIVSDMDFISELIYNLPLRMP